MADKKEKTQKDRIRDALLAGEILTNLEIKYWQPAIIELSGRVTQLKREGYVIETVKRGSTTGYYMPDKVDNRELAAWCAKPLIKAV